MSVPRRLDYDVVMATRNRPEAVELSLPLILSQSRPPRRVFIVDSSDDPAPIASIADRAGAGSEIPVSFQTAAAGLTHQRNVGLARTEAAVVLFPDDDSLLYPDAAERIMEVYEADTAGVIAGVAGAAAPLPPPGLEADLGVYRAEAPGPLGLRLRSARQRVKEALGALNPFVATGMRLAARHRAPGWLEKKDVAIVPYMTGFRMSFRRAVIVRTGFDETLTRYGWFEDIDASFAALRHGLVVTARRAGIYHHRVAASRANGRTMGLWAVLNRGYVVMKHVRRNSDVFPTPFRSALRLRVYCALRAAAYLAMARDRFGRQRAAGAREGLSRLGALIGAEAETLPRTYRELEAACLGDADAAPRPA